MRPQRLAGCLCIATLVALPLWGQSNTSTGADARSSNSATAAEAPAKATVPTPDGDAAAANPASSSAEMQGQDRPPAPVPAIAPIGSPAAEPGQMYLELKYNVDGTDLQGNKQRSFLHQGVNHTGELSYFVNGPFLDVRKFEFLAVGRYTNNPQVDPERNSLQRFYLRLTGPTFYANAGDDLVNYSRLTFSQNVKGLNMWKNLTPNWRLTTTVGVFADRWGSIYRNFTAFRPVTVDCQAQSTPGMNGQPAMPAAGCVESPPGSGHFVLSPGTPTKPYTRLVGGTRLERKIGRNGWLAGSWSHGNDLQQSLPEATITCVDAAGNFTVVPITSGCPVGQTQVPNSQLPGTEVIDNDTVSTDTRLSIQPIKLDTAAEFAYSWTVGGTPPANASPTNFVCASQPPVVGGAVLDARCFNGHVGDWAGRVEGSERIKKLNWRVEYARFEPNFFSANARQIRDLQDFGIRGDYSFIRQVTLTAGWRRSNDNLNGQRDFTSVVKAPEVRLMFQELPFYRRMTVEVGYRERNIEATGHPQLAEMQKTATRIPFASVTMPVKRSRFTLDYEHRHAEDAVNPQLSTDTDHFGAGLRSDFMWGQWEFEPTLRLEMERTGKQLPNNPALAPTGSGLLFPLDFAGAFDTNRSYQAGFFLEAPRYWRLEGEYRELNSVILSPLQPSPAVSFFYLNQGYKRPSWRASVTYKIANDENKRVTFFYLRTNNFFDPGFQILSFPGTSDSKSFRETVIGGTVLLRFRK